MNRGRFAIERCVAIGAGMFCAVPQVLAQFQNATVSVLAEARSHLDTAFGTDDRVSTGGAGTYPQFLGLANADQAIGPSGVQARAQVGLELSGSGLSASGSFFVSVSPGDGFESASVSALSSIWVDFTLAGLRTWRIDPGTTTGPTGNTLVTLYRGSDQVFVYSGQFSGASGEIAAGTYRLSVQASASLASEGTPIETGGTYTIGFLLGTGNPCPADLNGDHLVDDFDFLIFLPAYDTLACNDPAMPAGCPADLNGDGVVDDSDFVLFLPAYDALDCPTGEPAGQPADPWADQPAH